MTRVVDKDGFRRMTARYAIYYVPDADSALGAFGRRWFGHGDAGNAGGGIAGFSRERVSALTATCRLYGFHATLKAPFRLRETTSAAALKAEAEALAGRQAAVLLPPLRLAAIGRFLALTPRAPPPAVVHLAAACVRAFAPFRAPSSHSALARRRAAGLSAGQAALLARWGYPYVMAQFRFHMTLTDPIGNGAERVAVMRRLLPLVTPFERPPPLLLDSICLCRQDQPGQEFVVAERFPLAGRTVFQRTCVENPRAG